MRARICVLLAVLIALAATASGCQSVMFDTDHAVESYAGHAIEQGIKNGMGQQAPNNPDYQNYRLYIGIGDENKQLIKEALASGATAGQFNYPATLTPLLFPQTALGFALSDDSQEKSILALIGLGQDVNYVDGNGKTYLMDCIDASRVFDYVNYLAEAELSYVQLLLENGADPNVVSNAGFTALDTLLKDTKDDRRIDDSLIDAFLKHGAKVTKQTVVYAYEKNKSLGLAGLRALVQKEKAEFGDTGLPPIVEAAILGDSEKLKSGAFWGIPEKDQELVTVCTAAFANHEALDAVLKKMDTVVSGKNHGSGLMNIAARFGNLDNVKYLKEHGESPTNADLLEAIGQDKMNVARFLLENGVKVQADITHSTIVDPADELTAAAKTGDVALAGLVLQYGAPTDHDHMFNAMEEAIYANRMDMLKFLVDKNRGDISPQDGFDAYYPLDVAARWGNTEALTYLIGLGADVNGYQMTRKPLQDACAYGGMEAVKVLLANGANPDIKDSEGRQVYLIHDAIMQGDIEMLKALMEKGAPVDPSGSVEFAAGHGSRDILQYLLDHGGNAKGNLALHIAVRDGWRECVQVLLAAGADTTIKNSDGKTAYDLAVEDNNQPIMQLFADAGKAQGGGATPGAVDQAVNFAKGLIDKITGQ